MSNGELEQWVTEALLYDPKVESAAIGIAADDGEITLRGTVSSFREKREAQRDAERVYGVQKVHNELEVQLLMSDSGQTDADLRGAVLQALVLDSVVPSTVDASVEGGYVALIGTAQWQYQREEAELVAGNIQGVVGVNDLILLDSPRPDAGDAIKKAS